MQILYSNKTIATARSIKFLGLTLDTTLNWKHHISKLVPRLNKACYAIRSIEPFVLGYQTSGFRRTCPGFLVSVLPPTRHSKNQANVLLFLLRVLKATEPRIKLR
jgi:hypothetical protein